MDDLVSSFNGNVVKKILKCICNYLHTANAALPESHHFKYLPFPAIYHIKSSNANMVECCRITLEGWNMFESTWKKKYFCISFKSLIRSLGDIWKVRPWNVNHGKMVAKKAWSEKYCKNRKQIPQINHLGKKLC